ncbi:DNA methylase [bacterium BMS3Bbin04]|nr:DNA methylase [bacterium BMS3Bbin04]HDL01540.1 HD domain-containing protein [candidate division Zixibacteria bacterium]
MNNTISFADILYGRIELPGWLVNLARCPELVRLRHVRLSNVDSFEFKDLSGATRWEHALATAWLAMVTVAEMKIPEVSKTELIIAALCHDVATPPFAHTLEYIIDSYDHERESEFVIRAIMGDYTSYMKDVFYGNTYTLHKTISKVSNLLGMKLDLYTISSHITGDSDLGHIIHGEIDIDNADNVTRASLYMGYSVDRNVPIQLAKLLSHGYVSPSSSNDPAVESWLIYKKFMYSSFYEAGLDEQGRVAFLHYIIRKGIKLGVGFDRLIWSTDAGLLDLLHSLGDVELCRLVTHYRMLRSPTHLWSIPFYEIKEARSLEHPNASVWIESQLSVAKAHIMVLYTTNRIVDESDMDLLGKPISSLHIFAVANKSSRLVKIDIMRKIDMPFSDVDAPEVQNLLRTRIDRWALTTPWLQHDPVSIKSVPQELDNVSDWSFRNIRNESIHAYPSTFVKAIPSNLIRYLKLKGQLILDPFGGTGQTAMEAAVHGSQCISVDSNHIATMIAKTMLSFIPEASLDKVYNLDMDDYTLSMQRYPPKFDKQEKWYHEKTLRQLASIWGFIENWDDESTILFLKSTFSSLLTDCTDRRGRQHGYFADNTPLEKGKARPDYVDALSLYRKRIQRNTGIIRRFYSRINKQNRNVERTLSDIKVLNMNSELISSDSLNIEPGSVGAVITSPPYLCMSDYSLGLRLSYYWLFPEKMDEDFGVEIGPRRYRGRVDDPTIKYLAGIDRVLTACSNIIKNGGYIAFVLGYSTAKRFNDVDVLGYIENRAQALGLEWVWAKERTIQFQRNKSRSSKEDIIVWKK